MPSFAEGPANLPYMGGMSVEATEAPASLADRLTHAMQRAEEVCARMDALAERLCGSVPQAVNGAGQRVSGPPGVFRQLEDQADRLHESVVRANSAISRIENAI